MLVLGIDVVYLLVMCKVLFDVLFVCSDLFVMGVICVV